MLAGAEPEQIAWSAAAVPPTEGTFTVITFELADVAPFTARTR